MDAEEIKKQTEETQNLGDAQQDNLRFTRDINNEIREGLELLRGDLDAKKSIRKALNEINKAQELQVEYAKDGVKSLLDSKKLNNDLAKSKSAQAKLELNAADLLKKSDNIRNDILDNMDSLSVKQIQNMQAQADAAEKIAQDMLEQKINLEASEESMESMAAAATQIANLPASRAFDFLNDLSKAVPGMGKLTKGFEKAAEESKKAAASMVKINDDGIASSLTGLDKFKAGLSGLSAGAGELMKAFGPVAIIAKLLQGMMKADKSSGSLAKNLNMTYSDASALSSELLKVSASSSSLGVTYEGLKTAIVDINASLGTTGTINMETLKSFSKMQKLAGMTSEELMGITKLSLAAGGNLEEMTTEFMTQARISSQNVGVVLNEKELLKDISNISAATTVSLGKNPKALANAVATAKGLGFEMSNLEGIAESLLSFENSIEDEMQAELLLGRELNLDKARQAALNNDIAGLASAIKEEVGSSADFAKMNRLQQEALAKAVGMSREELAKTLLVEEQMKGATGDQAQIRREIFDKRVEEIGLTAAKNELERIGFEGLEQQASKQEEINLAAEKLNENFMTLGKELMPVLNIVKEIALFTQKNLDLILAGAAAYKVMTVAMKASAAVQKIIKANEKKQLGFKIAGLSIDAGKSAAAIPIIGFGLAAAAALAAFALGKKLMAKGEAEAGDDMLFPGKSGSGYGNRMISAPEGTFALNNKDTIIAGTNLDQGGSNMSNAELVKLQAQTNNLLTRLLNKNASIKMDSEELGTAISLNNYEISA